MRVVSDKSGMLEMSIINVIFLTNVEKWPISVPYQLLKLLTQIVDLDRVSCMCIALRVSLFWIWNDNIFGQIALITTSVIARHLGYTSEGVARCWWRSPTYGWFCNPISGAVKIFGDIFAAPCALDRKLKVICFQA